MLLLLLGGGILPSFSQPSDTSRQFLLAAAREIIKSAGNVALITQDEKGIPQVRTMDPFEPEADFTVWLATQPNTRKVQQIKNNHRVTLYYPDKMTRAMWLSMARRS